MKKNKKLKNKLDHARDLQFWLWSNKPAIKDSADFIFEKMKSEGKIGGMKKNRLKDHLKVVLTDLYVTHKHDKKMYIAVSRNRNDYWNHKLYSKVYLNYKCLMFVIDYLRNNGYIEYHEGIYTPRFKRKSRIRWTEKLIRLFRSHSKPGGVIISRKPPVVLKNDKKKEINFDYDTAETMKIIRNVNKINKNLKQHKIEHCNPSCIAVTEEMYECNSKYHRVFNNSSFEQGGRFYGHWSQHIESGERKFITIDGMKTVELDYSCLHISMLYGLEGLTPPAGDQYRLPGISASYRKVIKKAVNIAINAESPRSAMSAIRDDMHEFCNETDLPFIRPKVLLQAIFEKHQAIEKYFCTGYGLRLQYIDSMIAEKIMLTLGRLDIGCLCIHDSFIVAEDFQQILRILMNAYFHKLFNFFPNVNTK